MCIFCLVCSQKLPLTTCEDGIKYNNGTCYIDDEMTGVWNDTMFEEETGLKRVSPAEEYFK